MGISHADTPVSVTRRACQGISQQHTLHAVSDNLGARDPVTGYKRAWHLGTRYAYGDTYQDLIDRKALRVRIYPSTQDGTPTGKPVMMTDEQ